MPSGFVNLLDSSQVDAKIIAFLAQCASIEDLSKGTTLLEAGPSASQSVPMFTAQFPCKLVAVSLVQWDGSDVPTSDTNYWSISVIRYRAKVQQGTIVGKTTQTTGQAWAGRTDWNFDNSAFDASAQLFAKGDIAAVQFLSTGSPVVPSRILASYRIEPV